MHFLRSKGNDYDPLENPDTKEPGGGHHSCNKSAWVVQWALATIFLAFFTGIIGFLVGKRFNSPNMSTKMAGLLPSIGEDVQVWHLNTSFSRPPNEETEKAWESIIPIGRGFVRHSITDGRVGNIAVFHQIHCVHEMRVAYYTLLARVRNDNGKIDPLLEDLVALDGPRHIAHCFDYLRQVLMCASDTNIEYPDENGLLTGWGVERTCRDYSSVVKWAEQWRTDNRTEIQ